MVDSVLMSNKFLFNFTVRIYVAFANRQVVFSLFVADVCFDLKTGGVFLCFSSLALKILHMQIYFSSHLMHWSYICVSYQFLLVCFCENVLNRKVSNLLNKKWIRTDFFFLISRVNFPSYKTRE